jgi:hypothetical protein
MDTPRTFAEAAPPAPPAAAAAKPNSWQHDDYLFVKVLSAAFTALLHLSAADWQKQIFCPSHVREAALSWSAL